MLMRAAITLFCLIQFVYIASAQNARSVKQNSIPSTLFSINKRPVTVEEFIYLYKKNHQDPQKDFTEEKINEYLQLFVNFKLKVEEARRRGLDTTAAFVKEYNGYKDELRKPYLPDSKIVDSLVKLTYSRLKEEIKAAHILVNVKPDATPSDTLRAYDKIIDLRKRILAGEDFGSIAATMSDDPSAKMNRGDLGYFTAMQMVYPFETAVYTTPVGDVSYPVKTRFGYHLIKVVDRRPASGEVEVSHIMIRTGGTKNNAAVKNTIFTVHDKLQAGVSWDELCEEYSEDPSTKENNGRLRPFGTGAMSAVPEFERVAFAMQKPGEISDPFQTQYGWHVLRLERKIPLLPFDEMAPSLKARVARDERTELSKQELQLKLRKDFQFAEKLDVKTKFISLADSTILKGKWNPTIPLKADKEIIFTLLNNKYSLKSAIDYSKKNQRSSTLAPERYLEQLYYQFVDASITPLVEGRIIDQHPEYKFLLQEYYEGILLFDIMEKEVWNKASRDSVGQRSYYAAHTSNYAATERAHVAFYFSDRPEFRESLLKIIKDSVPSEIDDFVEKHKIKTELGYFKKDERPILQKVPWVKGIYTAENNGIYYLAWLKDVLPPGPMSFEEARPSVISDYQTHLEKNWVSELRKRYPVKVNGKGKQYILQQLEAKK